MQTVDEQPETIHLYVVREKAARPPLLPIFLSLVALSVLITVCALTPYQQPVTRLTIRVPAVLLPLRIFTSKVRVIPTGIKNYPATTAHGTLTITNGSIIGQSIPAGFTIQGIVTDRTVYVPGGNANYYGYATVPAHAVMSGKSGNLPRLAINQVVGSSVYVRNVSAFSGGHDAYSITYATEQDKQTAIDKARQQLTIVSNGLRYPCSEYSNASLLTWRCQFVTYRLPAYMHVSAIRIIGKNLDISIWFVPRAVRYWGK